MSAVLLAARSPLSVLAVLALSASCQRAHPEGPALDVSAALIRDAEASPRLEIFLDDGEAWVEVMARLDKAPLLQLVGQVTEMEQDAAARDLALELPIAWADDHLVAQVPSSLLAPGEGFRGRATLLFGGRAHPLRPAGAEALTLRPDHDVAAARRTLWLSYLETQLGLSLRPKPGAAAAIAALHGPAARQLGEVVALHAVDGTPVAQLLSGARPFKRSAGVHQLWVEAGGRLSAHNLQRRRPPGRAGSSALGLVLFAGGGLFASTRRWRRLRARRWLSQWRRAPGVASLGTLPLLLAVVSLSWALFCTQMWRASSGWVYWLPWSLLAVAWWSHEQRGLHSRRRAWRTLGRAILLWFLLALPWVVVLELPGAQLAFRAELLWSWAGIVFSLALGQAPRSQRLAWMEGIVVGGLCAWLACALGRSADAPLSPRVWVLITLVFLLLAWASRVDWSALLHRHRRRARS